MKLNKLIPFFIFFFIFFTIFVNIALADESTVVSVEVSGPIDQSSFELISEAINFAYDNDAIALILLLDTPGGGLQQTFDIADLIQNSNIPIIGFVYPPGSSAWSAGTFILQSTHIAAMSDHSIIGSCQPVEITITGTRTINESKTINALVEWIKERAKMYERNETLAEEFITLNRNVNSTVAKKLGAIEFTARSIDELLLQIDGYNVSLTDENIIIKTSNASNILFTPSFRIQFLRIISNPVLTSLLLMLGIFALIFGISSPGFGAEVFGVVAILLSLIGSGFAVSELTIIFIAIGVIFLFIELFVTPGFGVIGIGGVICLTIGAIFLIPTYTSREWVISMNWIDNLIIIIISAVVLISIFFLFLLYKVLQIRNKKKAIGVLIGETAISVDDFKPDVKGYVRFKGALWQAKTLKEIKKDEKVKIIKKDGAILIVEPLNKNYKH
jgi:membrane-bound serine protease (ClpP class)